MFRQAKSEKRRGEREGQEEGKESGRQTKWWKNVRELCMDLRLKVNIIVSVKNMGSPGFTLLKKYFYVELNLSSLP